MNGLTDIFYDVVDSAVSKECKRLSSSLFSEDYLNELTTNQEKALFKLFRNIASLSVKFEKGVAEYSPGIILYGERRTFDLDERWDLFLKLCQSEWTYFKKYSIYIDFQSYIKLTCQEIYFVEIYDLFNDKFGTHSIGDLSNEELLSWYDAISTIDLSNKKIVTFGNDLSNDVRNINRLITIRGRLMMALVKKNRQ